MAPKLYDTLKSFYIKAEREREKNGNNLPLSSVHIMCFKQDNIVSVFRKSLRIFTEANIS